MRRQAEAIKGRTVVAQGLLIFSATIEKIKHRTR
jgi:hypothetical protein